MATWLNWIERLATTWENGKWFARFRGAIAVFTDAHLEGVREAVRARFIDTCPDDALQYGAQDSNLERYPGDTPTTLRDRLKKRWLAWRQAGTELGLIAQLNAFGLVNVSIYENHDWDSPWPHDPNKWSRFWVVIDPPHPYSWPLWGQFVWGQFTWGMQPPHGDSLQRLVRKFKPAHIVCETIAILGDTDTPMWGHNMIWGQFTWGLGSNGLGIAYLKG